MQLPTRAVLTAALAAVVAVAGYLGGVPLAVAAALLTVIVALGWPALADLPAQPGSAAVVGLGGVGAVLVTALTPGQPHLRHLPVAFAAAVLLAVVSELLRRDGRERLVESLSGTVAGTLLAVTAAGWVAAGRDPGGETVVVVGAVALAVGSVLVALPLPVWLGAVVTAVAAAGAGTGAAAVLPDVEVPAGLLLGLAVGVLVATLHVLFDRVPALSRRTPALAAVALPVAVTGLLVYVIGRVLGG